jgi:hypothetical protein
LFYKHTFCIYEVDHGEGRGRVGRMLERGNGCNMERGRRCILSVGGRDKRSDANHGDKKMMLEALPPESI